MIAYLLLAALAWAVATRGGTSVRDLLIVFGIVAACAIVARAWPRRNVALWATFTILMCWLLVDGPVRAGLTLETIRVPLLVAITALTAIAVRRMDARERDTVVVGMIVLGCIQAVIALVEVIFTPSLGLANSRADALLGSPNGLGVLLVATSVLTLREYHRHRGWLLAAGLLLQGCALLATGSRTAIVIASALLLAYIATHWGWKRGVLAATGLIVGIAIVVWRTATELQDRPHLWLEALRRIGEHPLVGEGPPAAAFTPATAGARITTHAHNELLQWGVEYGLIGLGIGILVLVLAVRSVSRPVEIDRWMQCAALAILAAGLTDFTLRITALALTGAVLVALAVSASRPAAASQAIRRSQTVSP